MSKRVRLATVPVEAPGEWCFDYETQRSCHFWSVGWGSCELGRAATRDREVGWKRPQSCIDSEMPEEPTK